MAAAIIAPIVNSRKAAAIQQRINALEADLVDLTTAQLKAMTDAELKLAGVTRHFMATTDQLEAMATSEVVEEIWWSSGTTPYCPPWRRAGTRAFRVLLINDQMRELVARMTSSRKSGRSWRGKALRPREVTRTIVLLRGIRGLSERGRRVIDLFSQRLALYRSTGVGLVQNGPDRHYRAKIVHHEAFHLFQYRNRLDKRSPVKLIKHPATSTAIPYLKKHGYDVGNAASIVLEIGAYAFSGDHSFIGLRRREAEDWFSAYCRQFAVPRCAQIPTN